MPRNVLTFFSVIVVAWLAGLLLRLTLSNSVLLLILVAIPIGFAIWTFMARHCWWTIVPIAYTFGGKIYVGFRLFSHELAIALALAALVPVFLMKELRRIPRPRIPVVTWFLLAYLCVHCVYSIAQERMHPGAGEGNILRVYFVGLWPLIFAIGFTLYGSTRVLRLCLVGMVGAALLRGTLGLLGYYFPYIMYGRVFGFFMPTSDAIGTDLRYASILLVMLSLAVLSIPTKLITRILHIVLLPAYFMFTLIGGSRGALGVVLSTLAIWLVVKRKVWLLLTFATVFILLVTALNLNPSMLYDYPYRFRRTLSILVVKRATTDIHTPLSSSDQWHFHLGQLGLQNWLRSPGTFMFGNRVYSFDESFLGEGTTWRGRAEIASQMGYYESGLWTILAVLGLVGAVLYAGTIVGFLREPFIRLWRGPPRDVADAFAFIAVVSFANWLIFCWIAGHFPSGEIMFAAIARAAYFDRESGVNEVEPA